MAWEDEYAISVCVRTMKSNIWVYLKLLPWYSLGEVEVSYKKLDSYGPLLKFPVFILSDVLMGRSYQNIFLERTLYTRYRLTSVVISCVRLKVAKHAAMKIRFNTKSSTPTFRRKVSPPSSGLKIEDDGETILRNTGNNLARLFRFTTHQTKAHI